MMSDNEIEEEILEDIEEPELSFSESLIDSLPCLNLDESLLGFAEDRPSSPVAKEVSEDGTPPESLQPQWENESSVDEAPAEGLPEADGELESEGSLREISSSGEPVGLAGNPSRPGSPELPSDSPVLSNLLDVSSESHNTHSLHNDRSLSELSVSVPKLAVVSVGSDQPVSSLVRQFSHRDLDVCSPSSKSAGYFQSLPPCLDEGKHPPKKRSAPYTFRFPQEEHSSEVLRDKSLNKNWGKVANLISQFSVESSEGKEASPKQSLPSSITSAKDVVLSLRNGENSFVAKYSCSLGDEFDVKGDPTLPGVDSGEGDASLGCGLPNDRGSKSSTNDGGNENESSTSQVREGPSGAQDLELLCNIAFPGLDCAGEDSRHLGLQDSEVDDQDAQNFDVKEIEEVEQSILHSSVKANSDASLQRESKGRTNVESENFRKAVRRRPDSPYETNDTSEELLEIDIGESDQEMFSADLSDASEIIVGFISKSPISAITERTEESCQENDKSEEISEECADKSEHQLKCIETKELQDLRGIGCKAAHAGDAQGAPGTAGYFPSAFLSIENDAASSQFTGISSMHEEESIVQNQFFSLGTGSEACHPPSSQSCQHNPSKARKPNAKTKLPCKPNSTVRSSLRAGERCSTPPLSLHGQGTGQHGPLRAGLQRVTSKSMHNLALGAGGKPRAPILQNRSFSLSTDHLERQSPRAKSLSPGPGYEQRGRAAGDGGRPHSSMARRCLSAVALNRVDSQASMKRNQSVSLNRLNRSRSSSMTSVSSCRRADYSHVSSKVRQYIKDMKDKDLRNSTRSLPATPARKTPKERPEDKELRRIVLEELLLRDLSYLEEEEVPEAVLRLRNQIRSNLLKGAGQGNTKVLDQLLQLWAMERKLRYASDTTLAALQGHYNDLNTLYAEKQNEIDRLRFFRDVHRGGHSSAGDKRRLSSSCHNTPPPTPNRSAALPHHFHFQTSPNTPTRRLSVHTTPPNTPNVPSLSPSLASHVNKTSSSTPAADPSASIALEPNESSTYAEGSLSGGVALPDGRTKGRNEDVTLEAWIKDANGVLRRVKEFALLEGSSALQQNERTLIWNSILNQYWRLSSQFPMLSLLPGSQQSGALVQNLGQAISGTASRFQLEIVPSKDTNHSGHEADEGAGSSSSEVLDAKSFGGAPTSDCKAAERTEKSGGGVRIQNGTGDGGAEGRDLRDGQRNSQSVGAVSSGVGTGGPLSALQSVNGKKCVQGDYLMEDEEGEGGGRDCQSSEDGTREKEERSAVAQKQDDGEEEEPALGSNRPTNAGLENDDGVDDDKDKDRGQSPAPSPTPSHESMKTVGPLEKVTMWQESLIGSIVPHGSYHSSSNLSPAASLLSLGSSQPFEAENVGGHLADLDLKSFHPLHNSTALGHSVEKRLCEDDGLPLPLMDAERELGSGQLCDGMGSALSKSDLPQSPWKGGGATTAAANHLALGRAAAKARDLDSGCPGSERSTKVSQIASLEILEPMEVLNLQVEEDGSKGVELNDGARGEMACHGGSPVGRANRGCSDENEKNEEDVRFQRASGVREAKRGFPASDEKADGRGKENSSPRVGKRENTVPESHDKESSSHTDKREDLRLVSPREEEPAEENGSSRRDKHKYKRPPERGTSSDRRRPHDSKRAAASSRGEKTRQPGLRRYDAKYTSGHPSSSSSERSAGSSRSASSAEIHNNISRLKRDLNFLKSQMMNLTSEVFHEKRRSSLSGRNGSEAKAGSTKPVRTNVGVSPVCVVGPRGDDVIPRLRCPGSSGHSSDVETASSRHSCGKGRSRNPAAKKNAAVRAVAPSPRTEGDATDDSLVCKQTPIRDLKPPHHRRSATYSMGEQLSPSKANRSSSHRSKKSKRNGTPDLTSPGDHGSSGRSWQKCHCPGDVRSAAFPARLPFAEKVNNVLVQVGGEAADGRWDQTDRLAGDGRLRVGSPHDGLRRRGRSASPIIFIQNYNYGRSDDRAPQQPPAAGDRHRKGRSERALCRKHHRSGSSQSLMESLDEATSLAERLRLRSQSMLAQLHLTSALTSRHLSGLE
ncbi:uncharacterized protein [Macrobrachium rosenbergii]|uniref:uncharacterized protein isoform X2 n=1 Tax=Macrobrachium rosenbergii TaxID=79674 RepID=UPI0034D60B97